MSEENTQLDEFKVGDIKAEVPEPTGGEAPARRGDKKNSEAMSHLDMVAGLTALATSLDKETVAANYAAAIDALKGVKDGAKAADPMVKLSKEDIDLSDDVDAMLEGEELSDELKAKVKEVFEGAVIDKVNTIVESLAVNVNEEVEGEKESLLEDMATKLDGYLGYVAEQWLEDNKLAVDTGLKAEIVEGFLGGLKTLFTEHYIDLPAEKVDVVEELVTKVEEAEKALDEEVTRAAELTAEVKTLRTALIVKEVSEGLTVSQADKLATLAEGVEFVDADAFKAKLEDLKNTNFAVSRSANLSESVDESPVAVAEEGPKVAPEMAQYVQAIKRNVAAK